MTFQLCTRDEYNSTSIVRRSEDLTTLIKEAKRLICEDNVNNALTLAEQKRDWESCLIEFIDENDELIENVVYGGKTSSGKDRLYLIKEDEIEEHLLSDVKTKMRVYVGEIVKDRKNDIREFLFAEKPGRPGQEKRVESLSDQLMEGKTFYYVNNL